MLLESGLRRLSSLVADVARDALRTFEGLSVTRWSRHLSVNRTYPANRMSQDCLCIGTDNAERLFVDKIAFFL